LKFITVRQRPAAARTDPDAVKARIRRRLADQRALVRSLLGLREQLQGSLFVRYGVCGKETCACFRGERHGPYYVLSAGRGSLKGGAAGFNYLSGRRLAEARVLVERYRRFKRGLRRLKALNQEIVRLLRRYQESVVRRGGRRLAETRAQ